MKLLLSFLLAHLLISVGYSQELPVPKSAKISELEAGLKAGKADAVQSFWSFVETSGAPIIESIDGDGANKLVTFVWRGDSATKNVLVQTPYFPFNMGQRRMYQVGDTNVWYKTERIASYTRFCYRFSVNDPRLPIGNPYEWRQFTVPLLNDPLNSKHFTYVLDEDVPGDSESVESLLELPLAPKSPYTVYDKNVKHGEIIKTQFKSAILPDERRVWYYTPPGYTAKKKYPLVVFLDGWDYLHHIPAQTILDNLIAAGKIEPVVAVFVATPVTPGVREKEYYADPKFADLMINELLPLVRAKYSVTRKPNKTTVVGLSASGFAGAFLALHHSDQIGSVVMQSPALWWGTDRYFENGEWLTGEYRDAKKVNLRFYVEIGKLENQTATMRGGPVPVFAARHFADILKVKGYDYAYSEFQGTHDYINWRESLPNALMKMLGK